MQTYIINLKTSEKRRHYMENILAPYSSLDVKFIEALDGRRMSEREVLAKFDVCASKDRYGRELNRGEIGCVLSHRKAFETFLKTSEPYALILEDDISIIRNLNELDLVELDSILINSAPSVLFLSGDYWYYRKRGNVVSCYDALGAYAYIINRTAAQMMLTYNKPFFVADDWEIHKRNGLKLKAIQPYMVDANLNMEKLSSDVQQDQWGINRSKMSFIEFLKSINTSLIRHFLKTLGMFE